MSDRPYGAGDAGQPSHNPGPPHNPGWAPPVDPTASAAPTPQMPQQPSGQAWTPPSQPGLVPLRPMTLGTILSASFRVLRRNPRPLIGVALLTQGFVGVLSAALITITMFTLVFRLENVAEADRESVTAGSVATIIVVTLVPVLANLAVAAFLQGIVVVEVSRAVVGEKLTLRGLWRKGRGRFWALIGWTFVLMGAGLVVMVLLAAIVWGASASFGQAGLAVGVALVVILGLAMVVLLVWLGTKLSLVPSALMVERRKLGDAIRRSWTLTDRYFWRTFGIQVLVAFILNFAMQVISTPVSLLLPFIVVLVDPTGANPLSALIVLVVVTLVVMALIVALGAIALVVQSATNGLIFVDLRMRKEGLEIDLARFVELRDRGDLSAPDPYVPQPR